MMTFAEIMQPSHDPETIQKVADSLTEIYESMISDAMEDSSVLHLAVMAAAAGLLEAFANHMRDETAQPAAANNDDPLTSLDM